MKYSIILTLFSLVFSELKVGDPAPTFYIRTLEEKNFFMSDTLKHDKPIILSFFATWCVPCREEIPVLDSVRQEFPDMKFYLVDVSGLNTNGKAMIEDSLMVAKMINFLKVDILVLMDIYGKTAEKYAVKELPTLVVIDPKGIISYMHSGYKQGDENELISILNGYVNEKK
jgi:thiol-disulfide isomerase/thioredoxin